MANMHRTSKRIKVFMGGLVVITVAVLVVLAGNVSIFRANAFGSTNEIHGYAWSPNVGWISFNCADRSVCATSNYKTAIDLATGSVLSAAGMHYAWSSNIGWIDTNPAGGYPEAPNHGIRFDMATGVATGWARALSHGGGWDGWIKITDAKVGAGGLVRNSAGTAGGWAWGSNVVGWMQFTGSFVVPHVDCDFGADPAVITLPQKSELTWSCNTLAAANGCLIDNGVGSGMPASGARFVAPQQGTTYTLTCQGFGGPIVKTATVSLAGGVKIREVLP